MSSAACASYCSQRYQISRAFFCPTDPRQQPRAVAAVEAADRRTGLAEARVVGRDGEVAHDVQHVAAADRVARDHRDHRLGQPADLHLQVEHVEPADAVVVAVAVVAADALVAAGAERVGALAGEDDHADVGVVAGELERVAELEERVGPERVAHLGPADRDLGDAVGGLVADVAVAGVDRLPLGARADPARIWCSCSRRSWASPLLERSLLRMSYGSAEGRGAPKGRYPPP